MDKCKVIIFGGYINALSLIRALRQRANVDIIVVSATRHDMALYSKGICQRITNKKAFSCCDAMEKLLRGKISEWSPAIIMATDDTTVKILASLKETNMDNHYNILTPKESIIETITSKSAIKNVLEQLKISYPMTELISDIDELSKMKVAYPILVKPVSSDYDVKAVPKTIVASNYKELTEAVNLYLKYIKKVIIQQLISGVETNIVVYAAFRSKNGEYGSEFTGRKLYQIPPNYGTTASMIPDDIPEIRDLSRKLLDYLGYYGLCDIEFKYNKNDGKYYFIEMNPRSGKWVGCAVENGMNIVSDSVDDYLGIPLKQRKPRNKNQYKRWAVLSDLIILRAIYKSKVEFLDGKTVFVDFNKTDVIPSLITIIFLPFRMCAHVLKMKKHYC